MAVIALARLVQKSDLGTYQQLSLLYGFVSPLVLGGVPAALLYFLPRSRSPHEVTSWVVRACILLASAGALSAFAAATCSHLAANLFHNPQLVSALRLYAPYLLFAYVAAAPPAVLVAVGAPVRAAVANAIVGVFVFVAVISAALIRPEAQSLAIGLSVGEGLGAVASLCVMNRVLRIGARGLSHPAVSWRPLLSFGFPLAMASFAGAIGYQFDRGVVGANFPPQVYALYALGSIEFPLAALAQQSIGNALAPALATLWQDGKTEAMVQLFRESVRKTALVIAPLGAFMMAETPDIVRLLYGPGYAAAAIIFRIYLLYLPIRIATWGLIPQATGHTRVNFGAALFVVAGNVVLALTLLHPLGVRGPALAGPLTDCAVMLFYLAYIRHLLGARIRLLLPLREIAAVFVLSAVGGVALLPLQDLDLASVDRLALALCLFPPSVVLALRAARLLSPDDRARLLRMVHVRSLSPRAVVDR